MSRDSGTGSGFGINIEVDSDLAGGISEKDELMVRSVFLRAQQSRRRRPGGDEGRSPDRPRNPLFRKQISFEGLYQVLGRRTAAGPSLGGSGSPPGRRLLLWLRIKTQFRERDRVLGSFAAAPGAPGTVGTPVNYNPDMFRERDRVSIPIAIPTGSWRGKSQRRTNSW